MFKLFKMSTSTLFTYFIIIILSCFEYLFHYKFINYIRPDLNEKQKAYILSIKSSLTLFLIGVYYNYYYFSSHLKEDVFYNTLEETSTINLGKLAILYFTAYLIMDLIIGKIEYPNQIGMLSGYIHHISYIIINCLSLYYGIFPIYLLNMLSELPTLIMSLGSFDTRLRSDLLFGLTFFSTRIFYHVILLYVFRHNTMFFYLSLTALSLHTYWGYTWMKKYGLKLLFNSSVKATFKKSSVKNKATLKKSSVKNKATLKKIKTKTPEDKIFE